MAKRYHHPLIGAVEDPAAPEEQGNLDPPGMLIGSELNYCDDCGSVGNSHASGCPRLRAKTVQQARPSEMTLRKIASLVLRRIAYKLDKD